MDGDPHPLVAALDVSYRNGVGTAAAVLFRHWLDREPVSQHVVDVSPIEPYIPGSFYRRELPCLLAVLKTIEAPLATIMIDGYVWLSETGRVGMGARLYEELGRTTPVIGIAKTTFHGSAWAVPVLRGTSRWPLYVTAIGIDADLAAAQVAAMRGQSRLPILLATVDRLSRTRIISPRSLVS